MISIIKSKYKSDIELYRENFNNLYVKLKISHLPTKEDLQVFKKVILDSKEEDNAKVSFIFNKDEEIKFVKDKINGFIISGTNYLIDESNDLEIIHRKIKKVLSDQDTKIILEIKKNKNSSCINIYDELVFINTLIDLDLKKILEIFNKLLLTHEKIEFKSNSNIHFGSNTISYNSDERIYENFNLKDKKNKINGRTNINNTLGIDLNIIPCDFKIIFKNNDEIKLEEQKIFYLWETMFDKIKDLLSIIYLSDLVKVKDNDIEIIVNGYKEINININKNSCKTNDLLYSIYSWVYNGGNLVDKVLITRNVLSLHCRYINIYHIDADIFNSIKTNYKYYLKNNTEDFLEQKKDLQLIIIEESKKLSDSLKFFLENMLKNLVAYFASVITLFITNAVENGDYNNILTADVKNIFLIIIVGSIIYGISCFVITIFRKYQSNLYMCDLTKAYGVYMGNENVRSIIEGSESYSKIESAYKFIALGVLLVWEAINIKLFYLLQHKL